MAFTWQMGLVLVLLLAGLISFAWEKITADLTAMTLFAVLMLTGLLPLERAWSVFTNPAPITVACMFVISAALGRCGVIDGMARHLAFLADRGYTHFLFVMVVAVAGVSAFINNTPVVTVFMPVVLTMARRMNVPASKLLIPLSYAAIFGGVCTLIGTSTNILVSGIGVARGQAPLGMFEMARVGVPVLGLGTAYLLLFARRRLPIRETLTAMLTEEQRREYLVEAYVRPDSPMVGRTVRDSGLGRIGGLRLVDIVHRGFSAVGAFDDYRLEAGDRLVLACRPSGVAKARQFDGLDFVAETKLGLEQIAAHEGMIVEGVIGPNSSLIDKTLRQANFHRRYRMIVLAIHRQGRNLRERFHSVSFAFGDTLLLMGTEAAINHLRQGEDIILLDRPPLPATPARGREALVLAVVAAVVLSAAFRVVPIEVAALTACVVLFLTRCLRTADGYASIHWNILFIIFGMLGMGLAMEETGATRFLAYHMIRGVTAFVAEPLRPMAMLACVYLLTNLLTEILSNNAAAVLMAVLALGVAEALGVDARPFMLAVALAASASFSTPIGYQTNTYVYGVGGYRFGDFVRFGLPLNLLYFVGAMALIPRFWPF